MNWEVYPTIAICKSNFLPSNLMVTFSLSRRLLSSRFERVKVRSNVLHLPFLRCRLAASAREKHFPQFGQGSGLRLFAVLLEAFWSDS